MFTQIINPINNKSYSIFSKNGKQLLKQYVKEFNGGSENADTGDSGDQKEITTQPKNKYQACCNELKSGYDQIQSPQLLNKINTMVKNCTTKEKFTPIGFKKPIVERIRNYENCKLHKDLEETRNEIESQIY